MKIILLKDIKKIGRKYDVKDVADGFALNSLIPSGSAVPATGNYMKMIEEKKKQSGLMKDNFKKTLEDAIVKLQDKRLNIVGKINEKGHLFAGIHINQIIEEFKKQTGMQLDEELFNLDKPIKEVGEHKVELSSGEDKFIFIVNIIGEK
ncbi:MAG: 50S ribosomal protein L9 [Candidatus Pacebacteria bacterium]|nr:50S ribosomal protein L9 [Candidatus Paceibacterota bacterium]